MFEEERFINEKTGFINMIGITDHIDEDTLRSICLEYSRRFDEKIYKIDPWNNFCRVFEIPDKFPSGYCFGEGVDTVFKMVDWFYPVSGLGLAGCSKEEWEKNIGPAPFVKISLKELEEHLLPFVSKKEYIQLKKSYIIIYSFGAVSYLDFKE